MHATLSTIMPQSLAHITYLVNDYDKAIAFFTEILQFELIEDTFLLDEDKRWVLVRPRGGETTLLLAKATTPEQIAVVGNQAGGRVFLFLYTDDFQRDYQLMQERGVQFHEKPRREGYGVVAVFIDLYGNKWDLLQPKNSSSSP